LAAGRVEVLEGGVGGVVAHRGLHGAPHVLPGVVGQVAGSRDVGDVVLGSDLVDRPGDDAVVEERLIGVGGVIDDDVGVGLGGEGLDAAGHGLRAAVGGVEGEGRPRRHVVDHLQHAAALVGVGRYAVLEHVHAARGQVAGSLRLGNAHVG